MSRLRPSIPWFRLAPLPSGGVSGAGSSTNTALVRWNGTGGNSLQDSAVILSSSVMSPVANDGVALGSGSLMWSDLFLAAGGVINWNNGNMTITHATGSLTLAGGRFILGENSEIGLAPALSADGKYTGTTVTGTSGYSQAYGDLVYFEVSTSRWSATDANSAAAAAGDSRTLLGIVVVAGTNGNPCTVLLNGTIRADAKFPTLTVGGPVYISETANLITSTQPTTTDVVIRIVGFAITTHEIYFNPSNDYITHT